MRLEFSGEVVRPGRRCQVVGRGVLQLFFGVVDFFFDVFDALEIIRILSRIQKT